MASAIAIGLIADVQYAALKEDSDDGSRLQSFSAGADKLGQAIDYWSARPDVQLVLSLGDIVEGWIDSPTTLADLDVVLAQFGRLSCDVLHTVGNHCVKFIPRQELLGRLGLATSSYYRRTLVPGRWTLLVLDTTELSTHGGWADGSAQQLETSAFLARPDLPRWGEGRMQRYNGGLGAAQMRWLRAELSGCRERGERVVVASHHCFAAGACRESHRSFNGDEVTELLLSSGVVALALAGHDHPGGFGIVGGVPFVTCPAVLESG